MATIKEQEEQLVESEEKGEKPKKLIIVTGFGPFIGHEIVNASWEAVKLLPDSLTFNGEEYVLEKQMISVEYAAVDKAVSAIWARKPELVIHCGVHGLAKCIHIEKLAYNHKFRRPDYAGKRLARCSAHLTNSGCGIGNDIKHCGFNVSKIAAAVEESCGCAPNAVTDGHEQQIQHAKVSYDVGDYLCGYIYIKSLDYDSKRSLFVHVPPIDKPFSSEKTSEIIFQIIEECVRQLQDDTNKINQCKVANN